MMIATDSNEYHDNHIFLFNDLFLITRQKKKGFELKGDVPLDEARIVNIADTESKFSFFRQWKYIYISIYVYIYLYVN